METVKNNEIVNTLVDTGVKDYTAKYLVERCTTKLGLIEELLQIEVVDQVVYMAYKTYNSTFITAFDKRSGYEIWREKTTQIIPDSLKDDSSLKELFYSTLKLGGIKDRLFAAINNPDERDIDDGDHTEFYKIMEVANRLPESVTNNIVTQVGEVNGIIVAKVMEKFYHKFGDVYFIKGDKVKYINLIGDVHIQLEDLLYDCGDLIINLFEDVEEPRRIQLLESVLRMVDSEVRVEKKGGGINLFFKKYDTDIMYHINDTFYISYRKVPGLYREEVWLSEYIKESKCIKAYSLLDAINNISDWDKDKVFYLEEEMGKFFYLREED